MPPKNRPSYKVFNPNMRRPSMANLKEAISIEGDIAAFKYYELFSTSKDKEVLWCIFEKSYKLSSNDVPEAINYLKQIKNKEKVKHMIGNLISRSKISIKYKAGKYRNYIIEKNHRTTEKIDSMKIKRRKDLILKLLAKGPQSPFLMYMDSSFTDDGNLSLLYSSSNKNYNNPDLLITPKEFAQALKLRYKAKPLDKTKNKPTIYVHTDGAVGNKFKAKLKKELGKLPIPDIFTFHKD
jgi:hypothetical protein